jgi:hypothetical protein
MAQVANTTAADIALIVKGAASQTGNLLDVQNSAGTSLAVVNSSGNIGIGTTTPFTAEGYGALTVDGSGGSIYSGRVAGTETFRIQSFSTQTNINGIANVPLIFLTNSTERMRIDSAGAVGIGATPPAGRRLFVGGNLTGNTTSISAISSITALSDVTAGANGFR